MAETKFAPASKKQEMFINSDAYITVYGGAAGSGKAQPLYSKVLTTSGWKTMGEIQVGDSVVTPDNSEAEVLETYFHESKEIYELTTESGNIVRACNEHLWQVDIQSDGVASTEVCDTDDIISYMSDGSSVYLPVCQALGKEKDARFSVSPYDVGFNVGQGKQDDIPDKYLIDGSIEQRKELLRGLSDSTSNKIDTVITESTNIRDLVQDLVRSLGGLLLSPTCDFTVSYKLPKDNETFKDKIVSISYVGLEDAKCIYIDSPEHLYITDGYTVTHNTFMGLMRFLLYIHDPHFVGYVFRETAAQMKKGGGIFPAAVAMFSEYFGDHKAKTPSQKKLKITKVPMQITFPSGATINFVGLDGDKALEDIRGIEISAAMIDEASSISEEAVLWVTTRLRTKAKMIPNIWMTCNPMPDAFLRKWLEPHYLYPRGTVVDGELVEGRANPKKDGKLIWYLRVGSDLQWADTKKELIDRYSRLFPVNPETGKNTCNPRSFKFISANCFDNPVLMEADPNYASGLLNQTRVEKERLFYGKQIAA